MQGEQGFFAVKWLFAGTFSQCQKMDGLDFNVFGDSWKNFVIVSIGFADSKPIRYIQYSIDCWLMNISNIILHIILQL